MKKTGSEKQRGEIPRINWEESGKKKARLTEAIAREEPKVK